MSDLQCAATLLLVPVDRAEGLAGTLTHAKVARVWTGTAEHAVRVAELAAAELGVAVTTRSELDDPEQIDLSLSDIADEHRGETVVVLAGDGDAVVEVVIDGDGWVRRPWAP